MLPYHRTCVRCNYSFTFVCHLNWWQRLSLPWKGCLPCTWICLVISTSSKKVQKKCKRSARKEQKNSISTKNKRKIEVSLNQQVTKEHHSCINSKSGPTLKANHLSNNTKITRNELVTGEYAHTENRQYKLGSSVSIAHYWLNGLQRFSYFSTCLNVQFNYYPPQSVIQNLQNYWEGAPETVKRPCSSCCKSSEANRPICNISTSIVSWNSAIIRCFGKGFIDIPW